MYNTSHRHCTYQKQIISFSRDHTSHHTSNLTNRILPHLSNSRQKLSQQQESHCNSSSATNETLRSHLSSITKSLTTIIAFRFSFLLTRLTILLQGPSQPSTRPVQLNIASRLASTSTSPQLDLAPDRSTASADFHIPSRPSKANHFSAAQNSSV